MLAVTNAIHWVKLGATPKAIQVATAGEEELATLKKRVKAAYHELMLEHHPDRGGDIEEAKALNLAYEEIMAIESRAPPIVPQVEVVIRVFYSGPLHSRNNTTTSFNAPFFWREG